MTVSDMSGDQDRIDLRASEWVVLMSDRALTEQEADAFQAWLGSDPRHSAAWREFETVWATIPALDGLAEEFPLAAEPVGSTVVHRWWTSRGAVAAMAASVAVLVGALAVPSMLKSPAESFSTGLSESRLVALEDGSQVTLGPRSRLTVNFERAERRVVLANGEAFFEVFHDPKRPFYAEAGGAQTRVLGTKFDVDYAGTSVRVGVLEGVVQVRRLSATPASRPDVAYIRAGQGAEVALGSQTPIMLHPVTAVGAWRDGRLIYENARLADVAADANRYYLPGVQLADRQTGDLRITASFKPSEIGAFMAAIDKVVPVSAKELSNGGFRLKAVQR